MSLTIRECALAVHALRSKLKRMVKIIMRCSETYNKIVSQVFNSMKMNVKEIKAIEKARKDGHKVNYIHPCSGCGHLIESIEDIGKTCEEMAKMSIIDKKAELNIAWAEDLKPGDWVRVENPYGEGHALRYNANKPELSYLLTFPNAIKEFAAVCMKGAEKYERGNYLKGAPTSEYVDCLMRHLTEYYSGVDIDPDSGKHHLGHVVWNALMLAEVALTREDRSLIHI